MERREWQESLEESNQLMCMDCFYCKCKNGLVYCKNGNFEGLKLKDTLLLTPYDYDCWQYEEA